MKRSAICLVFLAALFQPGFQSPVRGAEVEIREQFPIRGFHLDLKIQVMTPGALREFARELAGMGFNTLVTEWEASFPFDKHATISNRYAYTRQEVESFISYCGELGIDVIPLQQCFGHVEYILRHDRYAHLKEDRKDICQLCPLKKEQARQLFTEVFSDIASLHHSEYIHIGGDETYLLGHCDKCAAFAAQYGKSRLYVDYMKMICDIIIGLGKRPVLWADIVLKHPEAVARLPQETVFVDWNYGWALDHFGDISVLKEQGSEFWGSPALRSHPDNYYLSCWGKHFNNLRDFIPYARKSGYTGIVMTSWSTSGQYGFEWDNPWKVVEMHTIRHVYPLSGFRILVAAYAQALEQVEPIEPPAFVAEYAAERFGFDNFEARRFWEVLTTDPSMVETNTPLEEDYTKEVLSHVRQAQKKLGSLKPRSNEKEFEHFRLMFDIREQYLAFMEIQCRVQSPGFSLAQAERAALDLGKVMAKSSGLDERFRRLNAGFLHDSEIEKECEVRNKKMRLLYERLARKK
ncbi:MAG: family 20 glycosylhydrolase [Gemmatimonadota bacterium]|nr:family 20 glycosylhydrolase [Gemmatimonadota bacterium]